MITHNVIIDPNNGLTKPRNRAFKPIYKPSGRAREYGEYAINIYTGCDNGCYYCYAPKVLHTSRGQFERVQPRFGILPALREQLSTFNDKGKTIALCFTCDPYPRNIDNALTREVIQAIKQSGNYVQILTKNPISRDFDIMRDCDWFGVTLTGKDDSASRTEPGAMTAVERLSRLFDANVAGIKTWISLEPVLDPQFCYDLVKNVSVDLYRIGKLNYFPSDINWARFGHTIEDLCIKYNRPYYIKEDLRREMEKSE